MKSRTIMVQGTSSSAGKSVTVTALCRILKQEGYRVAPFKSQNMSLNAFVTREGGEIGRAQAVQAEAARIEPSVHMNPVLLKPQSDSTSQVIVQGKVSSQSNAANYYRDNSHLLIPIAESLNLLRSQYDVVIIEGAGSPAEINLMDREIANMRIAELAGAPVILVGDIDRGGVFASLFGTVRLLPIRQRRRIKGFIINKFRGDISLLQPGLKTLERLCRKPVLGVIPCMRNLAIAQEDSVYLDNRANESRTGIPDICIIRLPHISNYDDFDPLETSCNVRYVSDAAEIGSPDLLILPGTKSTISDMHFLHTSGLAGALTGKVLGGTPVIGICGGYQMLGRKILDRFHTESDIPETEGLGLLDIVTEFKPEKITCQVSATVLPNAGLLKDMDRVEVTGYEIHNGRTAGSTHNPVFRAVPLDGTGQSYSEGMSNAAGTTFGSYMHGLFNSAGFTQALLRNLAAMRGLSHHTYAAPDREKTYDDIAAVFRQNLDMDRLMNIIFGGSHGGRIF